MSRKITLWSCDDPSSAWALSYIYIPWLCNLGFSVWLDLIVWGFGTFLVHFCSSATAVFGSYPPAIPNYLPQWKCCIKCPQPKQDKRMGMAEHRPRCPEPPLTCLTPSTLDIQGQCANVCIPSLTLFWFFRTPCILLDFYTKLLSADLRWILYFYFENLWLLNMPERSEAYLVLPYSGLHTPTSRTLVSLPSPPPPIPLWKEGREQSDFFMSSTGQTTSSANLQLIIDALANYAKITGIDLSRNPFTSMLEQSNSPGAILELLQEREKAFKDYREGNRRLFSCLSPAVNVIHAFSGILGEAVSLHTFHLVTHLT